jgi:hypothetical protein
VRALKILRWLAWFALGGLCALSGAALFFIVLMILNGGL